MKGLRFSHKKTDQSIMNNDSINSLHKLNIYFMSDIVPGALYTFSRSLQNRLSFKMEKLTKEVKFPKNTQLIS